MSESFFLSNLSPQSPSFNMGIWSKLENQFRQWVTDPEGLYIATGGILTKRIDTIGVKMVTLPSKFYKVLYSGKIGMIAFVIPNEGSTNPLKQFVATVDSVESLKGIDFPSGLDVKTENQLEREITFPNWNF